MTDDRPGGLSRKTFLRLAGAGAAVAMAVPLSQTTAFAATAPATAAPPTPDQASWQAIVEQVRGWWNHYDGNASTTSDLRTADETAIRADTSGTTLFEPFPYATPSGATDGGYDNLYGWDTYFINIGMLALGLYDQVRDQILDQLLLIERYGKVLNGNATFYLTRGQPPLLPESVVRYHAARPDIDLLRQAYPLLVREYTDWWTASGHRTPTGLSTNYDSGDPTLAPNYAAEAETGLDWTPIFGGDVLRCVPLLTNSVLVRYTNALASIATAIGAESDVARWRRESRNRASRMNELCWDDASGWFLEYDFVAGTQLPYRSVCALWPLWAGVATPTQARRQVANIGSLQQPFGLATTDREYPSPHPEYPGWLQWEYPAGWPPMQIVAAEALELVGESAMAKQVATIYLNTMMDEYARSGQLWEKYNVTDGTTTMPPAEHAGNRHMHGWTSAALVLLGNRVFAPSNAAS